MPLEREASGAHDDGGAGTVAEEELLDDEPGLDGLAEPDVVSEEEVGPRLAQGTAERFQLVRLDVGAAAERCLYDLGVGRRDCAPAEGVDEGCQAGWGVEPLGVELVRKPAGGAEGAAWLQLPDDSELLPQTILLDRLEGHGVLEPNQGIVGATAREALGLHIDDGPCRAANVHDLTRLRH
jgi:hypothetical protein